MISTSPLRYPGGKARFSEFICNSIAASGEKADLFVEPFCGGSGAALALLAKGHVKRIALNDTDPLVSSFWKVVFGKSSRNRRDINWLVRSVEATELSITEWRRQKALKPQSVREAAWKCLYLNRTSFNGILHQAGPIGGWEQKNRTLDVRFNREKLIKRINDIYELRDQVDCVAGEDWKIFCDRYTRAKDAYIYLDPPYYHRAEQLYGYFFNDGMHRALRDYLLNIRTPWMLSYDDALEVRALYANLSGVDGCVIDQTYSAHPVGGASFVGRELFFTNRKLPVKMASEREGRHVGLSVVGPLNMVKPLSSGPIRTPIFRMAEAIA